MGERLEATGNDQHSAFMAMDTDGDHILDLTEFRHGVRALRLDLADTWNASDCAFRALDIDHDETLRQEEFLASLSGTSTTSERRTSTLTTTSTTLTTTSTSTPAQESTSRGTVTSTPVDIFGPDASLAPTNASTRMKASVPATESFGSRAQAFAALDRDGNGRITPEEMLQGVQDLVPGSDGAALGALDRLDADGSGDVDPSEFATGLELLPVAGPSYNLQALSQRLAGAYLPSDTGKSLGAAMVKLGPERRRDH